MIVLLFLAIFASLANTVTAQAACSVDVNSWGDVPLSARYNRLNVSFGQNFIFNEQVTYSLRPEVNLKAIGSYNNEYEVFEFGPHEVGFDGSNLYRFRLTPASSGFAALQSRRYIIVPAGTSAVAVLSGAFTRTQENARLSLGVSTLSDAILIGTVGSSLQCIYRSYSTPDLWEIQFTATGTGDITITVGSTDYVITVSVDSSLAAMTGEIEQKLLALNGNFDVEAIGNVLFFQTRSVRTATTLTIDNGVTTIDEIISQNLTANVGDEESILEADFINPIPSGLNISALNLYRINYASDTSKAIVAIYEAATHKYVTLCELGNNVNNIRPTVSNPNMQAIYAASLSGAITDDAIMYGNSMTMSSITNPENNTPLQVVGFEKTVDSLPIGTLSYFFTLKMRRFLNGELVSPKADILQGIFTTLSTRGAQFIVYQNCFLTGPQWQEQRNGESFVLVDESATAFSGCQQVTSIGLGRYSSEVLDLSQLSLSLFSGGNLTFVGQSIINANDGIINIDWAEYI